MVISSRGFPLCTVFGSTTQVQFPDTYMWGIHKRFPGLLKIMAHSHPNNIPLMSEEDRTTLKAWTIALSPYPIYMEVVSYVNDILSRMRYWYEIESLEEWCRQGKIGERKMKLREMDMSSEYADWIKTMMAFTYKLESERR